MTTSSITIISFGQFDHAFIRKIADAVANEFFLPVHVIDGYLDLSEFYDPARRQYDGNKLIKEIEARFSAESQKTFGLFNVDLFIPILTYIFGQAFLNGNSAVGSVYRLSNERYGLRENKDLLLERSKKEVIHELGHTFGLIHCHVPACVMESSTYVEDIDQKNAQFCPDCKNMLMGMQDPE